MYKLKRVFIYIKVFFIMLAAKTASLFAVKKAEYKDLWIVSERGSDARDNGYHFFKYLRTAHPEINAVYVITKDSPDRAKVAPLGTLIDYGSFRHYLSYLLAKVRISSHINGYSPDILFFRHFGWLFPNHAKNVFLQHGVTKDDLNFCHAENTDLDLFICCAVPEYEFIGKTFGYPPGVPKLTGFCRFDALKKPGQPGKKILLMPTWRSELRTCGKKAFEESEYFRRFNSFLNSRKLSALLEEFDYELIFYPHFEIQRYIGSFRTSDPRVFIADFSHNDVQDLLISTDILLTDYSSVLFDCAYMREPMVFYQFDYEEFRRNHYKEGYFDYKRDGFGPVVTEEDEVIDELRKILENGLRPDDRYLARMNAFFCFDDTDNCRRNYDAVRALL